VKKLLINVTVNFNAVCGMWKSAWPRKEVAGLLLLKVDQAQGVIGARCVTSEVVKTTTIRAIGGQ
jgi:hypothetical protein